ncbi:MAG: peptidoglycan bridge formation glycyltransferase FemA/FemB family protein [Candidatus Peregrinibacteria bacterium]|nr:peptidoglycan bridge formation glycyltransferase FemA/FemB family protein [Candidatus Peregrinibacteria bacterium]MCB9808311.1 peptidoglycan bridge formation glycyltransferase FemA/FemB family protein [Candidatus Peribacteria bacterium]
MDIRIAQDQQTWDGFLSKQQFRPFLQSWTMGEVYRDTNQPPIRLEAIDEDKTVGICQAIVVNARRGRHLAVPYGPVISGKMILDALKEEALKRHCSFIRLSPFLPEGQLALSSQHVALSSPLHLLAEHIWYIPLQTPNPWEEETTTSKPVTEEEILKGMRKNTRNLIRRAEKEGVTIEASTHPLRDLDTFITLHEETRKRHQFTPYTNTFFEAQVRHFSARNECTMYKALYDGEVIACSIHMHAFGETSYHHGASTHAHAKIPASYLLQWTAIQDALKRGDHVYNFWGISPEGQSKHPFAGVRTFKTGFGGQLLEIAHCIDVPLKSRYYATRAFETFRKWRRGF